jgi:hypothetical protein
MIEASVVGVRAATGIAVGGMGVGRDVASGVAVARNLGVRVGVGVTAFVFVLQAARLSWTRARIASVAPMIEMAVFCVSIMFTSSDGELL